MKKIIILVLVIGALAISPLVLSYFAKNQITKGIDEVNKIAGYDVAVVEQNDGYLSSQMTVRVGLDLVVLSQGQPLPMADEESQAMIERFKEGFLFNVDLQYGPVVTNPSMGVALYQSVVTFADNQEIIQTIEDTLGIDDLFTLTASMGVLGSGESVFSVPAIQFSDASGRIDFGGMNVNADLSGYGKNYVVDGTIAQTEFSSPDAKFTMAPATISGSGEVVDVGEMGTGDFKILFPSFLMSGALNMQARDFAVAVDVSQPNDTVYNIDYQISLASMSGDLLPQAYSDIDFHVGIENVSAEVMEEYLDIIYSGGSNMDDPQVGLEMVSKMLSTSPKLMIKNVGFSADNAVQLAVSGDLGVDNDLLEEPITAETLLNALPALVANLELSAHRDLLNMAIQTYSMQQTQTSAMQMGLTQAEAMDMQAQQMQQFQDMLNGAVEQGMVVDKGNNLLYIKANFQQGGLTVNDQPVAL